MSDLSTQLAEAIAERDMARDSRRDALATLSAVQNAMAMRYRIVH